MPLRDPFDDPFFRRPLYLGPLPSKKAGFSCLGAGCLILVIDAILFVLAVVVIAIAIKWVIG